ncbi:MAG: Lrp/AsnC family transcriptional regulator [Candidatus Bathyarchaeia archaeon]
MISLDGTSMDVLKEYLKDSRQSFREVSRNIGVSSGTVASRVRELQERGVIRRFTALLDYEKLGYELTAITEVTVSEGMMMEVGEKVAKFDASLGVYNITGDSDIMVLARFKTRKQLSDFTKTITKMEYVERTRTHLVLNTLKEDFGILP